MNHMPYFDRFDICEAHLAVEQDWNMGGWLRERPSNQRRNEATHVQLHRMRFNPGADWHGFSSLSENGKEIYLALEQRYALMPPSVFQCEECGGIFRLADENRAASIGTPHYCPQCFA